MTDFDFKEARGGRHQPLVGKIRLNKETLSVGGEVVEALGSPERVNVLYSPKDKVIRLVPDPDGHYKLTYIPHLTEKARFIRTRVVQSEMPLGFYVPISQDTFVHTSVYK